MAVSLLGGSQTGFLGRVARLTAAEVAKTHPKRGVGNQIKGEDFMGYADALACIALEQVPRLADGEFPFENQARDVPKDGLFADERVVCVVTKAVDFEDAAIVLANPFVRREPAIAVALEHAQVAAAAQFVFGHLGPFVS